MLLSGCRQPTVGSVPVNERDQTSGSSAERRTLSQPANRAGGSLTGKRPADSRRRPANWKLAAVTILAVASGIGAVLADLAPTGYRFVDMAWSFALGGGVVLAGSRSRRWALLICAGLAAIVASGWMALVGLAALIVAIIAAAGDRRSRVLGAVSSGLAVQSLVRIDEWSWAPVGASAIVATIAMGLVVVSGVEHTRRRWRRRIIRAAWIAAVAAMVFTVAFGIAVAVGYSGINSGVAKARDGVAAAGTDERAAGALFRSASEDLSGASRYVASPVLAPVRLVPIVAQQQRAVAVATTTARDLADTAAEGAALVERDGLRPVDGRVDTTAVADLVAPLEVAVDALTTATGELASLSSPWLVAPLAERLDELEESVANALPATELAFEGASVIPAMAGNDGPRRWLVMITTPAESRLLGGFVGNWAVIEAVNGSFDVVEDGGAADLNSQLAVDSRSVDASEEYFLRYGPYSPNIYFQNSSASPDFPTAARVASSFYEQSTGRPVQGVMALDPLALGAMVDIGGPITMPTLGRSLSGEELSQFLLVDLYNFDDATQDEIFSEAIEGAVNGLTDGALPGPGALAAAMGPAASQGRVVMWSSVPDEETFLMNLGVGGALPVNDGQDFLFVGLTNLAPNKIDTYIERQVSYDVTFNPQSGRVVSEATVVLTNTAPPDLPPVVVGNESGLPVGTAKGSLSLYTPLLMERLEIDGQEVGVQLLPELGWRVWSTPVEVPAGGSVTVKWTLAGVLNPGPYVLQWRPQPLVIDPLLQLDVGIIGESTGLEAPRCSDTAVDGIAANMSLQVTCD